MKARKPHIILVLYQRLATVVGAAALTLIFFLVLPLMQTISKPPTADLSLQSMDTTELEPPPPTPEPEPEDQSEPEPEPPAMAEEAPPMDLTQIEMAMNAQLGGGGGVGGAFVPNITVVTAQAGGMDEMFTMADLDQRPRITYQPSPVLTREVRQRAPGTVYVIFIVDANGRVQNPRVQKSTDPVFERPALQAVRQWKFEPGKRGGKPVRFRMRVPITFPKS